MDTKLLVLVFKKSNGESFRFGVAFPKDSVEGEQVKALGTAMIDGDLMQFKDGATLASLEKAYLQEIKQNEVSIA